MKRERKLRISKFMSAVVLSVALFISPISIHAKTDNSQLKENTTQTIKKKLKEFDILSGDKEVEMQGIKYNVNEELKSVGTNNLQYFPVEDEKFPIMTTYIYNSNYDFSDFIKNISDGKIRVILKKHTKSSVLSNIKYEVENKDDVDYILVNYKNKLSKKTKNTLSRNIVGKAMMIPWYYVKI